MNNTLKALFAAGSLAFAMSPVNAQVLIGSVSNQAGDGNAYYGFKNNAPGAGFFRTTNDGNVSAGTIPVAFTFNIAVPAFPTAITKASMFFSSSTAGPCTVTAGQLTQPLNGGTLSIFVSPSDPTYGGTHGNELIFKATYASAGISQDNTQGNPQPTFGFADPSDSVVFTSAYFTSADPEKGTFSFSSGLPIGGVSCNANGQLNTQTMGGNGNFSAGTVQTTGVPEPGVVTMLLGTGVAASMFMMRRRRRN